MEDNICVCENNESDPFYRLLSYFLLLPPALLTLKYFKNKPAWWVISMMILGIGWITILGAILFYFQYLSDLISQYQEPPQELIDRWANDGAKKVFGLLFGWLYSLIYSLPWLFLYFIATTFRRRLQTPSNTR